MIHPIKSIKSRKQVYQTKNFEKTKYGKRLSLLKDKYAGQTCFIIGNGPSLRVEDLIKLHQLDVPSFAFNRIFCIFDEIPWRPTYYISQDENVVIGKEKEYRELELKNRFHPIYWKWYKNLSMPNSCYYKTYIDNNDENIYGFSTDFSKGVVLSATVAYTAFQLAYYMGFKKIYLIGFDQNYKVSISKENKVVVNENVKADYFSDKYKDNNKDNLLPPNLFYMNQAFISVDYHIKNGDIDLEVFNATRGGMLEVFPRVDLDEVFKELEGKK